MGYPTHLELQKRIVATIGTGPIAYFDCEAVCWSSQIRQQHNQTQTRDRFILSRTANPSQN